MKIRGIGLGDTVRWKTVGTEGKVIALMPEPSLVVEWPNEERQSLGIDAVELVRSARTPEDLPTEPGYYLVAEERRGDGPTVIELLRNPAGCWVDCSDRFYLQATDVASHLAPLSRLVEQP